MVTNVNFSKAAGAYQQNTKLLEGLKDGATGSENAYNGPSFAQMIGDTLESSLDTVKNAESLKLQSVTTGKVEMADLVTAIANAELTVNTVVAVRDRVISAYQDILRMPI